MHIVNLLALTLVLLRDLPHNEFPRIIYHTCNPLTLKADHCGSIVEAPVLNDAGIVVDVNILGQCPTRKRPAPHRAKGSPSPPIVLIVAPTGLVDLPHNEFLRIIWILVSPSP